MESCGSVLEYGYLPFAIELEGDEGLDGVERWVDVGAIGGYHAYICFEPGHIFGEYPDLADDGDVRCCLMVLKDEAKGFAQFLFPAHLAAIETDDVAFLSK